MILANFSKLGTLIPNSELDSFGMSCGIRMNSGIINL